jgi:hypothetical protein
MLYQYFYRVFTLFFRKKLPWLAILSIGWVTLIGCSLIDREYTLDDQYSLARSRIDSMKEQLGFGFILEKEVVYVGDEILFTAHLINKTNVPLTLRIPQQSGVLDLNHANTRLEYSITPLDKTVSLLTPLSYFGMPYIFSNPVQSNEFVILEPDATKDVKLELPNSVYLKKGETWVESVLPPGQYLIHITYKNLYIGYQIDKNGHIYVIDKSAWVGQIDAEPVLLTVLP